MKNIFFLLCSVAIVSFADKNKTVKNNEAIVTNAAMPSLTKDTKGTIYMVFAKCNQLECVVSADNGISFSKPVLVDTIAELFGVAGRRPHIISTPHALAILALDKAGNIYAYTKVEKGKWVKNGKVNDVP